MTVALDKGLADAAKQVEEAGVKVAAAEKRADEAEKIAQQAHRDAETQVKAATDAAATVQAGLEKQLDRMTKRLDDQDK
ncbi:hypothetical protein ACFYPA_34630 [Streptomyces sp. NPDC005775]|uniref:hypothetical protein n=1 Tax=Streptomyces sp. NPDC005775 TaxID=3364729 RepID=UPI0036BCEB37